MSKKHGLSVVVAAVICTTIVGRSLRRPAKEGETASSAVKL